MLYGKKYTGKAISSLLLVALLLIHSVRLLHSHPNNSFCSKDIHSNSVIKNSADCCICNYQLAKDTDAQNNFEDEVKVPVQNIIGQHVVSFYKTSSCYAFVSRGPPPGI